MFIPPNGKKKGDPSSLSEKVSDPLNTGLLHLSRGNDIYTVSLHFGERSDQGSKFIGAGNAQIAGSANCKGLPIESFLYDLQLVFF